MATETPEDIFASLGMTLPVSPPASKADDGPGRPASSHGFPGAGSSRGFDADADDAEEEDAIESLRPSELLWHEIRGQLRPAEVDEVKSVLGSDLVDKNEGLHAEALAFFEILRDLHLETSKIEAAVSRRPVLPPTPAHKLLQQQIRLLIDTLHSDTPNAAGAQQLVATPRDKKVFAFATADDVTPSPLTARPRTHSNTRPLSASLTRPSSSLSMRSAPEPSTPTMKNVTAFTIDKVAHAIRQALKEESEKLLDEIEYLQMLAEEEHSRLKDASEAPLMTTPSVAELREYEGKLQQAITDQEHHARTEAMLQGDGRSVVPSSPGKLSRRPLGPLKGSAGLTPSPPAARTKARSVRPSQRASAGGGPGSGSGSSKSQRGLGRPPSKSRMDAAASGAGAGAGAGVMQSSLSRRPPMLASGDGHRSFSDSGLLSGVRRPRTGSRRAARLRAEVFSNRG